LVIVKEALLCKESWRTLESLAGEISGLGPHFLVKLGVDLIGFVFWIWTFLLVSCICKCPFVRCKLMKTDFYCTNFNNFI